MNKRQRKKQERKREAFIASFTHSYRELRELDRAYHNFVVSSRRKTNYKDDRDILF